MSIKERNVREKRILNFCIIFPSELHLIDFAQLKTIRLANTNNQNALFALLFIQS